MPNNNDQPQVRSGAVRRLAQRIQANSDALYRSTYYSDISNKQQLQDIKNGINATIKDIMDTSVENIGEPNISKLFERMKMAQSDAGTLSDFERIFGDNEFVNNLSSSYLDQRWVKAIDQEIDEVLRYMPKLQEALMTIRDNVLSADSFSKDYLNIEASTPNQESAKQFARNIDDMKQRYKLLKLISEIYDETSKYGECFIYCVPYTKAIQRLLDRKDTTRNVVVKADYHENAIIIESADSNPKSIYGKDLSSGSYTLSESDDNFNVALTIEDGYISSIIEQEAYAHNVYNQAVSESLMEQAFDDIANGIPINEGTIDINYAGGGAFAYNDTFNNDLNLGGKLPVHHKFDSTLSDHLDLPEDSDPATDGLYNTADKTPRKIKEMNGCIIKKLKRERITPIILNDICLGYYYFELDSNTELFENQYVTSGMVNTITGLRNSGKGEAFDSFQRREELLRSISANLAEKIDAKFIDANQDLKKEIYYILKYNDSFNAAAASENNIRVSYIPPEDIQHFYFELEEDTKRGKSDLWLSLVTAKLWVAIYITNCLAVMTRGNDKRVYYVRQTVESNISKTLLKTVAEIKKGNFGIRQIENINNVLNITGRFNDYIIPRGADGQSPIEFEVMQGQNIEIKTELLNLLEESAINPTGVPIEIIQNRQSPDYAMQLTMSNSKFLRFVYARQSDFQSQLSDFISKIYDIEYSSTDRVEVTLPPPLFINVTNTNQLIVNTNEYCNNITEIIMASETDEGIKTRFSTELKKHYLGSYLNMDVIESIKAKAEQLAKLDYTSNPENIEGGNNS